VNTSQSKGVFQLQRKIGWIAWIWHREHYASFSRRRSRLIFNGKNSVIARECAVNGLLDSLGIWCWGRENCNGKSFGKNIFEKFKGVCKRLFLSRYDLPWLQISRNELIQTMIYILTGETG
jgi:hypothetical protein